MSTTVQWLLIALAVGVPLRNPVGLAAVTHGALTKAALRDQVRNDAGGLLAVAAAARAAS